MEWMSWTKWLARTLSGTMTRKRPVHSFQNTLDLAAINAWVLYMEINDTKIPRRYFLQNLAEELGMLFMRRTSTPTASETVEEANQHQQETAKSRNIAQNPLFWQMPQMQKISVWKMYCKHRARVHKL